jgi:hypothetical protein
LVSIRITDELVSEAEKVARREDRSRSRVLLRWLRRGYESEVPRTAAEYEQAHPEVNQRPAGPVPEMPTPERQCKACEGPLRLMKGKWVCCKIGCSLQGQVQG